MLSTLPKSSFVENLNTRFRTVLQNSSVVELELIEVKDGRTTPRQEQFSLFFQGPLEPFLGQGTFRLEHDRLESGDLFLVPVEKGETGLIYQAVFNRTLA
jgi:Domain of unknown function (DUF6916)